MRTNESKDCSMWKKLVRKTH